MKLLEYVLAPVGLLILLPILALLSVLDPGEPIKYGPPFDLQSDT